MLLIYQPKLYPYRKTVFDAMRNSGVDLYVVDGSSYSCVFNIPCSLCVGNLFIEWFFLVFIILCRPKYILLPINLGGIASYLAPPLALLVGARLFFHGQGDHRNKLKSPFYRFLFKTALSTSYKYISYGNLYSDHACFQARTKPVDVINRYEVLPCSYEPTISADQRDLLFIGRPRNGSCILNILPELNTFCVINNISAHLIGIHRALVDPEYHNLIPYGQIYQTADIQSISTSSCIGFYYGDCGLSVLHYMSLGLCPLVHSSLEFHMGPEPCLVQDQINGALFLRGSTNSFFGKLAQLASNPGELTLIRRRALACAKEIHSKRYSQDLLDVILAQ